MRNFPRAVKVKRYGRKEAEAELKELASKVGKNYFTIHKEVSFHNSEEFEAVYTVYMDGIGLEKSDSWRKSVGLIRKKVIIKTF